MRHKTLALCQKAAGVATDAQLSLINGYTLREFAAEELVVREYALAHNCIDRDRECFDEALLQNFATTLPGKGAFIRHPGGWDGDSGPGEGRVFQAAIETMSLEAARTLLREPGLTLPPDRSTVTVLKASAYYVKTTENASLLLKMEAGIASDVSIGFNASDRNRIKQGDIEVNVWRWEGPGEALEMSVVWLGAQPGARATKSHTPHTPEDSDMEPKDNAAAEELKTVKPKATQFDAIKAALGTDAALADDPAALAALVACGKTYRSDLIETVIKSERLSGALGDTEQVVSDARKEYEALPLRTLKFMAEKSANTGAENNKPGITGGDPNAAKHAPDPQAGKDTTPALFAAMN